MQASGESETEGEPFQPGIKMNGHYSTSVPPYIHNVLLRHLREIYGHISHRLD